MNEDIRWQQRLSNYSKALAELESAVELSRKKALSKLEEQGLIQCFEYTHELAWKTLKDFLENRGVQNLFGSKDTTREAFKLGIIRDGEVWMDMIKSRNLTSHTYDEEIADKIAQNILHSYFSPLKELRGKLALLQKQASSQP